jgi:glucose-6-phosphate 1-dehydrogenase
VLQAWDAIDLTPVLYPAGSEGPVEADLMLDREGRRWRKLDA